MEKELFWKLGEALKPEINEHEASAAAQELFDDNVKLFAENEELKVENKKLKRLLKHPNFTDSQREANLEGNLKTLKELH